ncbi:thiamine phosphate synthase [Nanoarchaeota archaeon]
MKYNLGTLGVYLVTDRKLSKKPIGEAAKDAIVGGVKIIQYREKELSYEEKLKQAKKLRRLTKSFGVIYIINDDVKLAKEVDADGVHLGQDDMTYEEAREILGEDKIIGVTAHNSREAILAEGKKADYIALSPIFQTDTKKDAGKPAGIKLIEEVRAKVKTPLVAIGGINENNILQVARAGIKTIAMISAIITKDDVAGEIRKYNELILKN